MKKFLSFIVYLVLLLIIIILFNTFTFNTKQLQVDSIPVIEINETAITNLSKAVTFRTISHEDPGNMDSSEFQKFHAFLKSTYPLTDSLLEKTIINKFSLLYKWNGSDKDLDPIILMAHQDVVPADESSLDRWAYGPFSGKIANDTIYGRGTLDDKGSLIAIMESVEWLLANHFNPKRTIYLAFGHDEEIGGNNGAKEIAKYLELNNINAETILDEGMIISRGLVPGLSKDAALIGIAEKGFVSIELFLEQDPGHSSYPAKESAIDIMSNAISKLHKNQRPAFFSPPVLEFIEYIGPELRFPEKMVFANAWLFNPVIISIYEGSAQGNASVRTTTAPTIFQSGIKENVMPSEARAVINYRIITGETMETIFQHVESVINDERIKVKILEGFGNDPSPISSTNSYGYKSIEKTFKEVFPEVVTSPSLMVGGSDSKHYHDISKDIYRIIPVTVSTNTISSIHGINERISIEDHENAIRYYIQLIKNFNN